MRDTLTENEGYLDLSKQWAQRLMARMCLLKSKGITAAKLIAESFDMLKEHFLLLIWKLYQHLLAFLIIW